MGKPQWEHGGLQTKVKKERRNHLWGQVRPIAMVDRSVFATEGQSKKGGRAYLSRERITQSW